MHGIKNAQFSIYLHFICCTVMQRIKEAVAVKPTLKSLRDEISFLKAGFDAPLHSRVACIGSKEDFFLPLCMGVCACVCVCERVGARKKTTRSPVTRSSGQFCASVMRYTVRRATHVCDQRNIRILFIFSSVVHNLGKA